MLAEGIEVKGASLDNGLLHINLERQLPEAKARTVPIDAGGPKKAVGKRKTIEMDSEV